MSASYKFKWRKIVNQLRYIYEELEIVEDMSASAAPEFQKYHVEYCVRNNIRLDELNRTNTDRIQELYNTRPSDVDATVASDAREGEEGSAPIEETFSKLFKKLALQLHPDRLISQNIEQEEVEEKSAMFTKARDALDEKRYFVLIDYAEQLGIPLPKNYKQQTHWMKEEIEIVRSKVAEATCSYNYMFAECDTDEARDRLIHRFLTQLFGNLS